jgi:hypothetical protein
MTHHDYLARADLYLGRDQQTADAQGPRGFPTAANALRFALEEAAPVSLRGAKLRIGERVYRGSELISLYRSRHYPLARKLSNAVSAAH